MALIAYNYINCVKFHFKDFTFVSSDSMHVHEGHKDKQSSEIHKLHDECDGSLCLGVFCCFYCLHYLDLKSFIDSLSFGTFISVQQCNVY